MVVVMVLAAWSVASVAFGVAYAALATLAKAVSRRDAERRRRLAVLAAMEA